MGAIVSLGKAMITYSKKEEAALAMKKLYYEDELGENLEIDFFLNKNHRMVTYE